MFRRRKGPDPRAFFDDLRNQVLTTDPAEIGLAPTAELPRVWGALLETGYGKDVATVVSLGEGTTSLYTTSGFGIIGGGGHEAVVKATMRFLSAVEAAVDQLAPAPNATLPADHQTTIRALTFEGPRAVTAPELEFGERRHPLSELFYAGEAVLTELRLVHEARAQ